MKFIFYVILICSIVPARQAHAQDCKHYATLMQRAKVLWKQGQFQMSLNQLSAAKENCPDSSMVIDAQLLRFTAEITEKYEELEIKNVEIREQIDIAKAERDAARISKLEAEAARKEAEALVVSERKAKILADSIKTEVEKLNDLVLAKQIAIKSSVLDNSQSELKVALAKTAYQIFKAYNVSSNSELYAALFFALKSLNAEGDEINAVDINEGVPIVALDLSSDGHGLFVLGIDGIQKQWLFNTGTDNSILHPHSITSEEQESILSKLKIFGIKTKVVKFPFVKGEKDTILILQGQTEFDFSRTYQYAGRIMSDFSLSGSDSIKFEGTTLYHVRSNERRELLHSEQRFSAIQVAGEGEKTIIVAGCTNGNLIFMEMDPNANIVRSRIEKTTHFGVIPQISYVPSLHKWMVASYDGNVSLWESGKIFDELYYPLVLPNHNSWVMTMAFDEKSNSILTGCKDGTLHFWPADMDLLHTKLSMFSKKEASLEVKSKIQSMLSEIGQDLRIKNE